MKVENDFFPKIAGELGSTKEEADKFQKKLDAFRPTYKVIIIIYVCVFRQCSGCRMKRMLCLDHLSRVTLVTQEKKRKSNNAS